MKIFDLPVMGYDRAKSFYGKAKIIETENGEKVLQSYNTFVCRITAAGRFIRMWGGGKAFHRCRVQYTRKGAAFIRVHGYRIPLDECIRMGV